MAVLLTCVLALGVAGLPAVAGAAPARADVGVTIDDRPDPLGQHQTLTYSVTTVNGATAVTGVTLSLQLPNDVTFKSAWTSGGTCSGTTTVVCTQGSLAAYASASATVNVQPKSPGTLSATARVKANERDSYTGNNTAVATTTVTESQNVDFAVSASGPTEGIEGDLATYAFRVANQTPAGQPAGGVTLVNQMPDGMELVAARSSIPCYASTTYRNITCQKVIAPGETFWVEATVRVVRAGSLVNSAQVSPAYGLADTDYSDNSAQVVTDVRPTAVSALATPSADLMLYAWPDAVVIAPGATLTYQYFGRNLGPSTAPNARLTTEIPPNTTFVSATNAQGPCTSTGTTVSCELGDLPPGTTIVTSITVRGLVNGFSPSASVITSDAADALAHDNSWTSRNWVDDTGFASILIETERAVWDAIPCILCW